jgi:hypothetical protein
MRIGIVRELKTRERRVGVVCAPRLPRSLGESQVFMILSFSAGEHS